MSNSPFFTKFVEPQVEELTAEEIQQCAGGTGEQATVDFTATVTITNKDAKYGDFDESLFDNISIKRPGFDIDPGHGPCF